MFFVFNVVLFLNLFLSNVFCLKSSSPTSTPSTKSIIWPSEFSQQFITPNGQFQSSGTLFFSEALKTTRIDHSPGSFECFKFYNTTQGCSLIMNEKGFDCYCLFFFVTILFFLFLFFIFLFLFFFIGFVLFRIT